MMKRFLKFLLWIFALGVLFLVLSNVLVVTSTRSSVIENIDSLDTKTVALVFGTSKSTQSGNKNLFFADRIRAATELYRAGKIRHIIVSGDNRTKFYNEPRDMLRALEIRGIPEDAITLDYAGLRTLDTVVRCKEIFGQTDVILVTQAFHANRAQFIAERVGLNSQVFAAEYQSYTYRSLKQREYLARALAVSDLYIFKRSPKYLGDPIQLEIDH